MGVPLFSGWLHGICNNFATSAVLTEVHALLSAILVSTVITLSSLLQILYKDSELADSSAAEPDAATNTDDGGDTFCSVTWKFVHLN